MPTWRNSLGEAVDLPEPLGRVCPTAHGTTEVAPGGVQVTLWTGEDQRRLFADIATLLRGGESADRLRRRICLPEVRGESNAAE
jgi:hypothetical protein